MLRGVSKPRLNGLLYLVESFGMFGNSAHGTLFDGLHYTFLGFKGVTSDYVGKMIRIWGLHY